MAIQIVLGYPIQVHSLLLTRCKYYFRLFAAVTLEIVVLLKMDWIMTGGKHWLFHFMKEPSLFVESIKISRTITSGLSQIQVRTGAKHKIMIMP